MNLLTIENVTKSYTEKVLLNDVSFSLNEGEKVGIIGINGTGKTTLLKIIAGIEEADTGKVTKANHVIIRYLPQNPVFEEGSTILEAILKDNITNENKWTIESEAKAMLNRLGVTDYNENVDYLSGGQKKRVALVATLLSPADILVLDEPTNHLDNTMADWLEEYLKKWKKSLVMVTHDRYFLDSISNRIVEIDKGSIYSYETNYSGFLELKQQREDMELATERKRQSILKVELEWIKRGARARSTKQKARIERFYELKEQSGPQKDGSIEMSSISSRLGRTTIEIQGISKAFGEKKLINDFSYIFLKQDRIGFIGANGCGKSTLMKMLIGKEKADSGEIIIGQTVKKGYYAQEIESKKEDGIAYMDPNMRVIDYIRETAEYVKTKDGSISASQMLERFLFPSSMQYTLIGKLSGGEKRRLNLLRVLMEAPNVLILDEPTNDLDIQTLTILESYLDEFDGIVITVSHDRYFLDRVVRRIFAFEQGGILRQYEGGYTDYMLTKKEDEPLIDKPVKAEEKKSGDRGNRPRKLKFSYQEQKDYETIEQVIQELEEKLENIDIQIGTSATDFIKLNELTKEKEEVEQLLEEKMERWMYLMDLEEKIKNQ